MPKFYLKDARKFKVIYGQVCAYLAIYSTRFTYLRYKKKAVSINDTALLMQNEDLFLEEDLKIHADYFTRQVNVIEILFLKLYLQRS